MKTSTIKQVTPNGTFDSNYGTMFKFEYLMEDGSIVNANHKTAEGFLPVGTLVEYEITNAQYNNGKVARPQPQQTPSQSQGTHVTNANNTSDAILYQVVLKGVMDYYTQLANGSELDQLLFTSENINQLTLSIATKAKENISKL